VITKGLNFGKLTLLFMECIDASGLVGGIINKEAVAVV